MSEEPKKKKTIRSWSFSRYQIFKQCKRHAKLKYIDRVPEGERELRPGQTEHANDRGNRVHKSCEDIITGVEEILIPELNFFQDELHHLRQAYADPTYNIDVTVEEEWGFDGDFLPREYKGAWLLMKADITYQTAPTHKTIVDLKTGKRSGNEVKHAEQVQLYGCGAFARDLELKTVDVELWYADQDQKTQVTITREDSLRHQGLWLTKGHKITDATVFPPNPNIWTCQYCPYSSAGNGACDASYVDQKQRQKFFARRKP